MRVRTSLRVMASTTVAKSKRPLPGQLAVVDDSEQQIAQLAVQMLEVATFDGIGHFVGLLQRVRDDTA